MSQISKIYGNEILLWKSKTTTQEREMHSPYTLS